ncbi:hypothetical protein C8J56DRAFT_479458 [Mycena floridula]|nr:hypothetical protein C8J56DRAFT_479458 [Mycena floridula]
MSANELHTCEYETILLAFVQLMGHYKDADRAAKCMAGLYEEAMVFEETLKELLDLYYATPIPDEQRESLIPVVNTILDRFRHRKFDGLPDATDLAFSVGSDGVVGTYSQDLASTKSIFTMWHVEPSHSISTSPSMSTTSSRESSPAVSSGSTRSPGQKRQLDSVSDSFPRKKSKATHELPGESATFANEHLVSKPFTNHAVGVVIQDANLSVWWHDREYTIRTSYVDIKAEPAHLAVLLILFQRFSESDWGSSNVLRISTDGAATFVVDGRSFVEQLPVRNSPHKRTFTVPVVEESDSAAQYFLKASFGDAGQCGEAKIVEQCHILAAGDHMILDHIPKLVAAEEFDETLSIRSLLSLPRHRPRLLRILVFERLEPIISLKGDDFWQAFWDIIRCHYLLWQLGVHHRDISVNNLMYNPRTKKGVLNDFDLAIIVGPSQTSPLVLSSTPTGTMPFIAMELLAQSDRNRKFAHLYRHDLESFCWALMCICGGCDKPSKEFLGWSVWHQASKSWERKFFDHLEEFCPHAGYARYERAAKGMIVSWRNLERKRLGNMDPTVPVLDPFLLMDHPPFREYPDALHLQGMLALVNSVEGLHVDLSIPLPDISVLLQSPKESQPQ